MKKRQNTSYAVMAQRIEAQDSLDDFPTPPWATRALIEHVLGGKKRVKSHVCLEPACGAGHMAKVLSEYFGKVQAADIHPHGYGDVRDFLGTPHETNSFDWVITNPPFRLGEDFTSLALKLARRGVAMLTRTVFIESVGRYDRLFSVNPPSHFAQFTERVPMVKGRLDRRASTATGYCWLVWIPPCRKALERDDDYELPAKPVSAAKSVGAKGTVNPRVSASPQVDLFR